MTDNQQHSRACPDCGVTFSCSANRQCWCMEMPAVLPLNSSSNSGACYCRRCLSKRVAAQLEQLIASKTS